MTGWKVIAKIQVRDASSQNQGGDSKCGEKCLDLEYTSVLKRQPTGFLECEE